MIVFHWSLCDSNSHQFLRTLLSILAEINNAVIWAVAFCPLISKSSNRCTNTLMIVLSAPITTGITVTLMFHSFFQFSCEVLVLIFLFSQNGKVHYSTDSLSFFLSFFSFCCLGLVGWPILDDTFLFQNPKEFCASSFLGQILGCAYTVCLCGQF